MGRYQAESASELRAETRIKRSQRHSEENFFDKQDRRGRKLKGIDREQKRQQRRIEKEFFNGDDE